MPKDTNIDNLYKNIEYKPHRISNAKIKQQELNIKYKNQITNMKNQITNVKIKQQMFDIKH